MDITSLELGISSSVKELSRFKNFMTACKHNTNDGYRSGNEILWDFMNEFDKLRIKVDAMTGKEKQLNLEMNSSSGIKLLTDSKASASKQIVKPMSCSRGKVCSSPCKGKEVSQAGVVEHFNDRLNILEEETKTMKQDILRALEERRNLVNDIYEQFQIIHSHLCLRNQVMRETCYDDTLIANSPKDGRIGTGLSEIFGQEPNLSLVTRDLTASMLAFQEPA
uniref:Uncharacterized protein n=1 Tax=Fagus sylvatica TaxID=28930 RepID=A0A2N9J5D6_FAGSY